MAAATKNVKSIIPLLDRVLIQRISAKAKTDSGIYLPESSQQKLSEGTVLAVGNGGLDRDGKIVAVSVKAGDRVLLPPFGGSPIKVGEEEYQLFRDSEILAIIKE